MEFNRGVAWSNKRVWLAGAILALAGSAAGYLAAVVTSIVG